jgi:glycosyltransferase involved in cell wall biosynthesis
VIAIGLLTLAPGRVGGSETYARELLARLDRDAFEYRVVTSPLAPDVGGRLPTVVAPEFVSPSSKGRRLVSTARAAADPRLRRHFRGARVVHFPLTVPLPALRVPTVISLLDLQHRDLPHLFSRSDRWYRALAYDLAARRAARVITISEFVRGRAIELLGLAPERVTAIPLGVDHVRFRPGGEQREPFLLYPARPWPHKNHARLYEAFALLRRERPELRLTLTGGGDFGTVPDGVDVHGLVSDDQLASLYRRAATLVFPSLYEGFGQPPLEAMASGCPVACSNTAALPEIVGDAARLFDPHQPEAIADALRDILDHPQPWTERGLTHAARYSWNTTAQATETVYRELL